jgi:hypothetical protein
VHGVFEVRQEASWFGGQAVFGLQWNFLRDWHLGLAIRSPVLSFRQTGQSAVLLARGAAGPRFDDQASYTADDPEPDAAVLQMVDPSIITLGAVYRRSRFWVGAEAELRLPAKNRAIGVDDRMQWNVRAGSRFWITPKISMGVGGFTERSPKRDLDPITERIVDVLVDYYGFTAGISWKSDYPLRTKSRVSRLHVATTVAFRYAAGVGRISGLHYEPDFDIEINGVPIRPKVVFHDVGLFLGGTIAF